MASASAADAVTAESSRTETSPPWRWRGVGPALAIVAIGGGLALRLVAPSPLWLDEALSVNIARLAPGDMVDALRHDGHPALYYLLLGWWMDLFGESDFAVRALSAVFSLLTVPVLWAITRRHGARLAGATVLVALTSPYLVRFGTEARMYALLVLLVALGWLAVDRALERPTGVRLVAVAVAAAALVHTHYWSFWVIGAALGILAWTGWVAGSVEPGLRRACRLVAASVAAGAASFAVWLGVFLDQLGSTGTPWADRARPAEIAVETIQALGGNNRFEGELLGIVMVGLALLGALAVGVRDHELRLALVTGRWTTIGGFTLLVLALGGGAALVTGGAFEARYAGVVVAFVVVLVARAVTVLPGRGGPLVLAVVVLSGLAVGVDEARRDRTQAAQVANEIDRGWSPGDVVVFCPDQVGPATNRELTADAATLAYPRGDGVLVDWRDYADVIEDSPPEVFVDEVVRAADGNDIWLVAGLGYKSLDNRCETIIARLDTSHVPHRLVAPDDSFEPMLLTRYEARS